MFTEYITIYIPYVKDMSVLAHWASLGLSDFIKVSCILLIIMAVITSNWLFRGFLAAKPEGRKTVIGEAIFEGASTVCHCVPSNY